ncbi:MAG TPA: hypothetical protein VIO61_08420 [Anaerolineaceae bacterium]
MNRSHNFFSWLAVLLALSLAACSVSGEAIPLSRGSVPQIVVEVYPVVDKNMDTPDHFEFNQRMDRKVKEKRAVWRNPDKSSIADLTNRVLNRYGYNLEPASSSVEGFYQLNRGQELVLREIVRFFRLQENTTETDFLLLLEQSRGGLFTLRKNGLAEWKTRSYLYTFPALAGDRLVTAYESAGGVVVEADGKQVYTQPVRSSGVDSAIKGVWSWQDGWVLETRGQVITEGKNLNKQLGCDEIFQFNLIAGQPAFFCRKKTQTYLVYAGRFQEPAFDEVIHYRCCEPAAFNPGSNSTMVWFYALIGNTWNYVEAGVYE